MVENDGELRKRAEGQLEQLHLVSAPVEPQLVTRALELDEERKAFELLGLPRRPGSELEHAHPLQPDRRPTGAVRLNVGGPGRLHADRSEPAGMLRTLERRYSS